MIIKIHNTRFHDIISIVIVIVIVIVTDLVTQKCTFELFVQSR